MALTIHPCPQCGSRRMRLLVTTEAVQHISIDTHAVDGAYDYTINHEDVIDTVVHVLSCRDCAYHCAETDATDAQERA